MSSRNSSYPAITTAPERVRLRYRVSLFAMHSMQLVGPTVRARYRTSALPERNWRREARQGHRGVCGAGGYCSGSLVADGKKLPLYILLPASPDALFASATRDAEGDVYIVSQCRYANVNKND
ncbi:hypothetical protein EVAR_74973_1 [Eumeta japonica]|uniref:Uncharacterized protein n=1 Tax=Eumeta variegata TaxID=151549 RepID=A0A4C1VAU7_EUMVA|nr:hypothetical protein EVAR_74973_1 [Eumeta japonica]